jgi:hypothetical protein
MSKVQRERAKGKKEGKKRVFDPAQRNTVCVLPQRRKENEKKKSLTISRHATVPSLPHTALTSVLTSSFPSFILRLRGPSAHLPIPAFP